MTGRKGVQRCERDREGQVGLLPPAAQTKEGVRKKAASRPRGQVTAGRRGRGARLGRALIQFPRR